MQGKVIQINTSKGGVPKRPIPCAEVHPLGIAGDEHRYAAHGGPQKALLLIASEVIDQLREEGWPVFYGALGENLTTQGLDYRSWRAGKRYRVGGIVLELTTPRQPCSTLNPYGTGIQKRIYDERVHALDPQSVKWGLSGFYASVVKPGHIELNDIIEATEEVL
jgi:MOSC domain-containing protein YiiM